MIKTEKASDFGELAPLRPLADFLFDSARFQIPNVKDLEKWSNRMASNLLYYQTNYFLLFFVVLFVVGLIYPVQILSGILAVLALCIFVIYIKKEENVKQFKGDHPNIWLMILIGGAFFIVYTFKSLLVLLMALSLSFSVILIHASLRLRNIKNKIANKVETLGFTNTIMGKFLTEMGIKVDLL